MDNSPNGTTVVASSTRPVDVSQRLRSQELRQATPMLNSFNVGEEYQRLLTGGRSAVEKATLHAFSYGMSGYLNKITCISIPPKVSELWEHAAPEQQLPLQLWPRGHVAYLELTV